MNPSYQNAKSCCFLKHCGLVLALGAAIAARADYPSGVLSDGPLLYFRLNESVTPLFDGATNSGTVGTSANGIYSAAIHPVAGIPGASGNGAANFPGGANMQVPYQAALNQGGPFTAEFWTRPGGGSSCPFNSVDFGAPQRTGWLFYQDTIVAGNWTFRVYKTGGVNVQISGGAVSQSVWHHVVGVLDSATNVSLYVDGVLAAGPTPLGADQTPMGNPAIPLSFGVRSDGGFPYTGDMDEVAYYTNALSPSQILAHYQAGTNSATTTYAAQVTALHPAGYWRLGEPALARTVAANLGTYGSGGNGTYFDGSTTVSGPRPADSLPGFDSANNATSFDGSSGYVRIPQAGNLGGASLTSVSEASFVCWIKRNGDQAQYKGLLAMRPLSTGLYLNTDNTLNYSWNDAGNTYGFNSLLVPPDGEWTLAAVTVQPTQAVFYMASVSGGFASITNPVTHSPADFTSGPFAVGRDINFGGAGRFFNGAVDEAAIFNRALNQGRLRTYFLTAIGDTSGPVLESDPPTVSPSGTIYSTTTFSISVDAYAASPTFIWRKNGVGVPGGTSATYTKANASTNDSGNYDVIVTNAYGAVTSSVVAITINPAVPPTITQQPASRFVYAGGAASFSLVATGTPPFSYQWQHAGTNLPGATASSVTITGVDATKTGNYSANVTNVAGNTNSATVALTIRTPSAGSFEAAVVGNAPIAYWRLDETSGNVAYDLAGGHDGIYSSNVTHTVPGALNGDSDGAATFNGTDTYVGTGVGLLNGLTRFSLTGWIRRGGAQANRTGLFGQNDNVEFGYISDQDIQCWDNILQSAVDAPNTLADGVWGFITVTSDGTNRVIYINGQPAATGAARSSPMTNNFGFNIGGGGVFDATGNWFLGDIDEVAVFNRALTPAQVNNLYLVGAYGTTTAPFFVQPPASVITAVGSTATFSTVAAGSVPLSYQWMRNGSPISGATASTLTLPNVYFTDTDTYSVKVSNSAGTNSASATLTVLAVPTFANQTNNLVLHLKFDGNYGDSSGRGNHATPMNAPVFVPGKIGSQAVQVNTLQASAAYNYVQVLDTNTASPYPDLQFTNTDSFTVAYWANYTGLPNDLPIIGNSINSTYQPGWVFTDDGGKLDWTLTTVSGSGQVIADPVAGSPIINNATWHHTLVSFDRASAKANTYIDGALVDTRSIAAIGSLDLGTGVFIGQDPTGTYGVDGTYAVDDVGIWRRALNSYEALSVYNAGQNSHESFDVPGPVKLSIYLVGNNIDVAWQAGTLYQAPTVNGPWTPVSGATAPFYRTTTTGAPKFFRVPPQ